MEGIYKKLNFFISYKCSNILECQAEPVEAGANKIDLRQAKADNSKIKIDIPFNFITKNPI